MPEIDTTIVMIAWSPTPHRLQVLAQSFASLKAHTRRPHILVVVDNGPAAQTEFLRLQDIDIHVVNEVNRGVGKARNQGAQLTRTDYLAFVDSDIGYFGGWLDEAIAALEKYPTGRYVACPARSGPIKLRKHRIGIRDEYQLYNRAPGQCLVLRRSDYQFLGGWSESSVPGGDFCYVMREHGYLFLHHPRWAARHLCKDASYDWRCRLVDGVWVSRQQLQESNT